MRNNNVDKNKIPAKELKALLSSVLMLVFSVSILIILSTSFAWFSNNKRVTSKGMSVSADASPNLVITNDASGLIDISPSSLSVVWNEDTARSKMLACTRMGSDGTCLKYITNPEIISIRTGLVKDNSNALSYANVPEDENSRYYVDYTVYIASHGKSLENSSLSAKISSVESKSADGLIHTTHKAATIEFYVGFVSQDNYKGSLNVAGMETSSVDLFEGDIPLNKEGYITVIMRCYFDGALVDTASSGNAYVNTYSVDTSGLSMNVRFTASEK